MIQKATGMIAKLRRRFYFVSGEQIKPYKEPYYSTNPKAYKFAQFDIRTKSPKHFNPTPLDGVPFEEYLGNPTIGKAFLFVTDAINFAYSSNLANAVTIVFEIVVREGL